ncbi:MAG: prolipoprotein diacylglyceryl transferase [Cytophagales bacterium]|jgi:prolipoprotein diacylglyceryl transferase|nr:prolipoprotein diacylglyceryl transferase [Cytophagales bacterium]
MVWNVDPVMFYVFGTPIKYYSLCWVLAFACGYIITTKLTSKIGWSNKELESFFNYVLLGTAIGARLGHCLFYDLHYYHHHLLEIFLPIKITESGIIFQGFTGLASHGAAGGIILSTLLFSLRYKKKWVEAIDIMGVGVPLGGALIRIGNFFNSEIVGRGTTSLCGIIFKRNDNIVRHPAQLYEACGYFLIALMSYYIFRAFLQKNIYEHRKGFIAGFFVTAIFLLRFFIEYVKESQNDFDNEILNMLGLNLGQLLSIPFVFIFSILMFWPFCRKK